MRPVNLPIDLTLAETGRHLLNHPHYLVVIGMYQFKQVIVEPESVLKPIAKELLFILLFGQIVPLHRDHFLAAFQHLSLPDHVFIGNSNYRQSIQNPNHIHHYTS